MKIMAIIFIAVTLLLLIALIILNSKLQKQSEKELKRELEAIEADTKKFKEQNKQYVQEKKENEELLQEINSGNSLDSFNAGLDLMQKLSQKGKHRNN